MNELNKLNKLNQLNEKTKTRNTGAGTIIKAVITGVLMFFILVLLGAFVFFTFMPKSSYIPTVFYIIMFLCAFITGVKSSASQENKGYIRGLISGIIYVGILTVIFIFLKKPFTAKTYITSLIALLISSAGGVVGINTK